jgi:hypothetical protein
MVVKRSGAWEGRGRELTRLVLRNPKSKPQIRIDLRMV